MNLGRHGAPCSYANRLESTIEWTFSTDCDVRTWVAILDEPWEHAGACWEERDLMDYQRHIMRDPKVCGGEPVIKGTRVTVRTVLASLAEGAKDEEILEDFPTLTEENVRAVIAFAAVSAEEDLPVQSVPDIQ